METKVARLGSLSMNQQASTAYVFADTQQPCDRVDKKASAEPLTLVFKVDGKPREQCDWLGVSPCPFAKPWWSGGDVKLRHPPCVVHDDPVVASGCNNEDSCSAGGGRLERVSAQPVGLFRRSAVELLNFVRNSKETRRAVGRRHSVNGEGRSISLRRPANSLAERRLISSHSSMASREQDEPFAVCEDLTRRVDEVFDDEGR